MAKVSTQKKVLQAFASWGSVLAPIGILFPGTNATAAKVTAKVPYGIGTILGQLQQATGVTTTKTKTTTKKKAAATKKKSTKKKQSSKKAKKAK